MLGVLDGFAEGDLLEYFVGGEEYNFYGNCFSSKCEIWTVIFRSEIIFYWCIPIFHVKLLIKIGY
jgi:hypothetical protein